jgi:hypothetical protein
MFAQDLSGHNLKLQMHLIKENVIGWVYFLDLRPVPPIYKRGPFVLYALFSKYIFSSFVLIMVMRL